MDFAKVAHELSMKTLAAQPGEAVEVTAKRYYDLVKQFEQELRQLYSSDEDRKAKTGGYL